MRNENTRKHLVDSQETKAVDLLDGLWNDQP